MSNASIFTYGCYRTYLKEELERRKLRNPRISLTTLSKKGNIKSKAQIKLVVDGERNLSAKSIPSFIQMLDLKGAEARYFEALVYFSQAKNIRDREYYLERLKQICPNKKITRPQVLDELSLFSNWLHIVLREMALLEDFQEDEGWICSRLKYSVTPKQVREAIRLLVRVGWLKRKPNKKMEVASTSVQTPDTVRSIDIRNFHRQMSELGIQALEDDQDVRENSSVTLNLSASQFKQVKSEIIDFRNSIIQRYSTAEGEGCIQTHHISISCFALTRSKIQKFFSRKNEQQTIQPLRG